MNFSERERKTLQDARSDARSWRYGRFIVLLLAIGLILLSFRLVTIDSFFLTKLGHSIRGLMMLGGVLLLIPIYRNWGAPKSTLLLKLADHTEQDAA
jgi:hypothetical protein